MNPNRTRVEANPHSDVGWSEFNLSWRKCGFLISDCINVCACASAMRSKEMTGRQQRGYSNPHSDVGWSEFNLSWRKCGFLISDCINVCACASAMRSKEMTGRQQRGYSLGRSQCVELAYDHSKTLPRFPCPSCSLLPMHIRQSLVASNGSSARWLATVVAAAAAMPFPGVTGTWH